MVVFVGILVTEDHSSCKSLTSNVSVTMSPPIGVDLMGNHTKNTDIKLLNILKTDNFSFGLSFLIDETVSFDSLLDFMFLRILF